MTYIKTLPNQNQVAVNYSGYPTGSQMSNSLQIRVLFNGKEHYSIGRRNLCLFPGSFLVLGQGTEFRRTEASDKKILSLTLTYSRPYLDLFHDYIRTQSNYLLLPEDAETVLNWNITEKIYPLAGDFKYNLQHLQQYLDEGGVDDQLLQDYLEHGLINTYMLYKQEMINSEKRLLLVHDQSRKEVIKRLNLAKEFLQSNYNKKISLEDVAAYSSFSINHLIRTFSQAYNQTPHQFLIRLRLQRARTLLKDTEYPVNEIGNIVGFESPSSFIRLFREYFDVTPLKFRAIVE